MPNQREKTRTELIAEIDAAYAKATPGKWEKQDGGTTAPTRIASEPDASGHKHTIAKFPQFNRQANSRFIVLLHNRWPEIRAALGHEQSPPASKEG
jgi:hypothetical protein